MSVDQIAEIQPAIREAMEGGPDTCVTFNVGGDPDKWVQFVGRTVNGAYPHSDDPEARVADMCSEHLMTKVISWESGKYATFLFGEVEATALAHWVDAYFVHVLSCGPGGYHVDIACEQI